MTDPDRKIRSYLRSRADVPVPRDLRWPVVEEGVRNGEEGRSRWTAARVLAAVIAAVAVVGLLGAIAPGLGERDGPGASGPTAASGAPRVDGEFPSSVAGMPVVSVAEAVGLVQRDELDGRAVAVAGYYFAVVHSCPPPRGYDALLEARCTFVALADDIESATLCTYLANGMRCRPPEGTYLEPLFVSETSGVPSVAVGREPVPVVVIGHVGDPRSLHCAADAQAKCAEAFVVDRVAWANGSVVPLAAPEGWDHSTESPLKPGLTLERVVDAIGSSDQVVAAAAFAADDISMIDPRWNLAGNHIVWIVRSLGDGSSSNVTRSMRVSLIDDRAGTVLDAVDLSLGPEFRAGRLWTAATTVGIGCCADDIYPFYRVTHGDGTTIHESIVGGGAHGGGDATTYGPGLPLILTGGMYTVTAWLATIDGNEVGAPMQKCSTQLVIGDGDDLMLEAVFPDPEARCAFEEPSPPRLEY